MTFVLKEQRFCNVGYLETFRYSVLILLVKLLNWWVEWGSKWHNIYLKIHHWIHEHMKSYNVAIKKKTYLALFLFKQKGLGIFCPKIDLDCYFIERIKHALFKFTSQSCVVTFFRLFNNNSYLSSRYIYTCNSHSMNVYLRNWYVILVTYCALFLNIVWRTFIASSKFWVTWSGKCFSHDINKEPTRHSQCKFLTVICHIGNFMDNFPPAILL